MIRVPLVIDRSGAGAIALRALRLEVLMFEDLGGRDDDAQTAHVDGVARGDVCVDLVADRHGVIPPWRCSPTHEEYREARRRGLRTAVWWPPTGTPSFARRDRRASGQHDCSP